MFGVPNILTAAESCPDESALAALTFGVPKVWGAGLRGEFASEITVLFGVLNEFGQLWA